MNENLIPTEKLNKDQLYILDAIDAHNIRLTDQNLVYTLKVCIEYTEEDNYGFAPKVCPDIQYNISLNGLVANETDKKYFSLVKMELKLKVKVILIEKYFQAWKNVLIVKRKLFLIN